MPYKAENRVCVIAADVEGGAPFAAYVAFDSVEEARTWMQEEPQLRMYRALEVLPANTPRQRAHAQKRLELWTAMES